MIGRIRSSRSRYREYYRRMLSMRYDPASRRKLPRDVAAQEAQPGQARERRSTTKLIFAFWRQVRSHRRACGSCC
jgi:hypothetical protein